MKRTRAALPFVFVNVASTADGKLAPASRHFIPFGSPRDQRHLLELRATADAVMSGARTIDLSAVKLGPGGAKYRRRAAPRRSFRVQPARGRQRFRFPDPGAEIFKHRFSPVIVLTTARASAASLRRLRAVADEVKICGRTAINFPAALRWLRRKWKVKRLLCEGGGEINAGLFEAGLVDEVHLTLCPVIFGGKHAPTPADGRGFARLSGAAQVKITSAKRFGDELFLVGRVRR